MGSNQALTWIVFTSVLIWIVVNFLKYGHLLVLLPTSDLGGKLKSKLIKYDCFELKWMRSECNRVSSIRTLYPSTVMKIRSFKIQ